MSGDPPGAGRPATSPLSQPYTLPTPPHPKRVPHHLPTLTHTHAQTGAHADARAHTHAHARTRMHTRTHARQTMASPCLRWRAPSARAASYLGGRVSYLIERGGPGAPMRDSSRPPSPGSRLGTSCAPCAWFVRATLGPRGGPVGVGAGDP